MMVQFIVAMAATLAFASLFQTPPRLYALCALIGGTGWVVNLLVLRFLDVPALACFCAALVLTCLARLASVARKTPVIVFLTAGIFPLVPGAGLYYTAYYLFAGNSAMTAAKGTETLVIAGTIALGILFGSAVPQKLFNHICGGLRVLKILK